MPSATLRLYLHHGDAKRLRTGEVSNWTGKALAAPRTEIDELLCRPETASPGVYFLFGADPESGDLLAYIGEAEVIRDRIRQHKAKEFWNSVVVFVSKDENLTKAHVRYLESRLMEEATKVGRYRLDNANTSSSKLPESDREEMEVFLSNVELMLPALGSDLFSPVSGSVKAAGAKLLLVCEMKGALARGMRTEGGFAVLKDSTAVRADRPSSVKYPGAMEVREKLKRDGTLVERGGFLAFTKDVEFSSPSAAASVIHGGHANGLLAWRDEAGRPLKELEGD